jgi:beta-N-acetylhexosaminidase
MISGMSPSSSPAQPSPPTVDQAKESLGELFITGFNGPELSDETSGFLSQARIGGVMIAAQNYESPAQMAELSNQIQACRIAKTPPLWVCVDHEGGKVQRLKKGFTRIPDAATLAATGSPKLVFEIAELLAKELEAVGINVNFAPVVDIATNPNNPVIGPRAFGRDEDTVSKMSSGMVRGHLVHGVQPCVKHFPGHGDTATDSHFALPKCAIPLEQLRERELKPFTKAFRSRCSMVMTAHVVYTQIDPKLPATLSPKILRDLLRGELRYTRLIVSDEMEMKAIADNFSAEDAPRLALEAGCDLLLYKTEAGARHAYASLLKALDEGKLSPQLVLEAAERSREHKRELLEPYQPADIAGVGRVVGVAEHAEIIAKVGDSPAQG